MRDTKKFFSKRLLEIRREMGITQEEMAKKLGTSRASYSLYENGKLPVDIIMLDELHSLTGLPFDYLMGYTDIKTPEAVHLDSALGISKKAIDAIQGNEKIRLAIGRALEHEKMPELADHLARFNRFSYTLSNIPAYVEEERQLLDMPSFEISINAEMHKIISLIETIYTPGPDEQPYLANPLSDRSELEKMLYRLTDEDLTKLLKLLEAMHRRKETCPDAPTAKEQNQYGMKPDNALREKSPSEASERPFAERHAPNTSAT